MKRAFTLIELLVVISIVALLSGIVLASLNTAREKGRIGGAKYFATQVSHTANEKATALWEFNECSGAAGSPTADLSGFGNNLALNNIDASFWSSDTPSGKGCAGAFDGTDDYGSTPNAASLNFGAGEDLTLSFWFNTSDDASAQAYPRFIEKEVVTAPRQGYNCHLSSYAGSLNRLACELWSNGGGGGMFTPFTVNDGKWHYVAFVRDNAAAKEILYFDGLDVAQKVLIGGDLSSIAPLKVATFAGDAATSLASKIDEVHVYDKSLTAFEISRMYAIGSARHGITVDLK